MIIEKFVLSRTAPRNKHVGWIDTSGNEPKIKFNVNGTWSEEYDPEQVQVDWNCIDTTSKAFIKNKPTIPAAQIQSDWDQSDSSAVDYIKNKPTVPSGPIVVEGSITEDEQQTGTMHFVPTDASININDIFNSFTAGTTVMLMVPDQDQEEAALGHGNFEIVCGGYITSASTVMWSSQIDGEKWIWDSTYEPSL